MAFILLHKQRLTRILLPCAALLALVALLLATRAFYRAAYPCKYSETVTAAAAEYDLPPSLVYAVIHTESGFNPAAESTAGAHGLMQITDNTYFWSCTRLGLPKPEDTAALLNPQVNIQTGAHILSLLSERYTEPSTVLAAYNAGLGTVDSWLADPSYSSDGESLHTIPYPETADYVQKVQRTAGYYRALYSIE